MILPSHAVRDFRISSVLFQESFPFYSRYFFENLSVFYSPFYFQYFPVYLFSFSGTFYSRRIASGRIRNINAQKERKPRRKRFPLFTVFRFRRFFADRKTEKFPAGFSGNPSVSSSAQPLYFLRIFPAKEKAFGSGKNPDGKNEKTG